MTIPREDPGAALSRATHAANVLSHAAEGVPLDTAPPQYYQDLSLSATQPDTRATHTTP